MDKAFKRRSESFFGIHFDFHARRGTHPVGHDQRPDIFAKVLDEVKPDYLQCDTKGHAGLSSYPTRVGNRAENMTVDNLRMLRDLTAERGLPLYGHHSGVYDMKAACDHPDWAVVDENGVVSREKMSVFGPYADELLIPQLIELAADYKLNGAWVDGECWGTKLDYSAHALRAWKEKTGREDAPHPGDADFEEYREFCREGFRKYTDKYVRGVKAVVPDFQVASNWLYSAEVPEKPEIPVDFISGDYMATNSYESARFHARCMMHQGLSWDLMAWGQQAPCDWQTDDRNTKELVQYCQEASVVLALGGGFEFFNPQYDGGCTVQEWAIPTWRGVAEFCRERKEYCFGAKSIPQTAIIFSRQASYKENDGLFGWQNPVGKRVYGLVQLCADCQLPADVLLSHQAMARDLNEFGLILVPDGDMEPELIEKLAAYAENGGRLLLCGPEAASAFGFDVRDLQEKRLTYAAFCGRMAAYVGRRAELAASDEDREAGYCYDGNWFEAKRHIAVLDRSTGAGLMEALCFDLGDLYNGNRTTVIRDFFKDAADRLFPDRMLRVSGTMYADVTLMRLNGKTMVNLINSAGPHREENVRGYSEVPAVGPITVTLACDKKPDSVLLQPGNRTVGWTWENGKMTAVIDRLALYDILVAE